MAPVILALAAPALASPRPTQYAVSSPSHPRIEMAVLSATVARAPLDEGKNRFATLPFLRIGLRFAPAVTFPPAARSALVRNPSGGQEIAPLEEGRLETHAVLRGVNTVEEVPILDKDGNPVQRLLLKVAYTGKGILVDDGCEARRAALAAYGQAFSPPTVLMFCDGDDGSVTLLTDGTADVAWSPVRPEEALYGKSLALLRPQGSSTRVVIGEDEFELRTPGAVGLHPVPRRHSLGFELRAAYADGKQQDLPSPPAVFESGHAQQQLQLEGSLRYRLALGEKPGRWHITALGEGTLFALTDGADRTRRYAALIAGELAPQPIGRGWAVGGHGGARAEHMYVPWGFRDATWPGLLDLGVRFTRDLHGIRKILVYAPSFAIGELPFLSEHFGRSFIFQQELGIKGLFASNHGWTLTLRHSLHKLVKFGVETRAEALGLAVGYEL